MISSPSSLDSGATLPNASSNPPVRRPLLSMILAGIAIAIMLEVVGLHTYLVGLSAAAVVAGFTIAAVSWIGGVRRSADAQVTAWDLAAAITFVGLAAAMIAN